MVAVHNTHIDIYAKSKSKIKSLHSEIGEIEKRVALLSRVSNKRKINNNLADRMCDILL